MIEKNFSTKLQRRINLNPNAFQEIIPEVKRILMKRFPYKVFYTVSEKYNL